MNDRLRAFPTLLAAALLAAGCQAPDDDAGPATSAIAADMATGSGEASGDTAEPADAFGEPDPASPSGKPTAPVTIDYHIVGTPIVGQPVNVNLEVSSRLPDRPVRLSYRINDREALAFTGSQSESISLGAIGGTQPARQQVQVVPQREGRLYLNVAAEVQTDDGTVLKSMAIPIQVGRTPGNRGDNGSVQRDENGEAVRSLPAEN